MVVNPGKPNVKRVGFDSFRRGIHANVYCGYKTINGRDYVDESKNKGSFKFNGFEESFFDVTYRKLPARTDDLLVSFDTNCENIVPLTLELGVELLFGSMNPIGWIMVLVEGRSTALSTINFQSSTEMAAYGAITQTQKTIYNIAGRARKQNILPVDSRIDINGQSSQRYGYVVDIEKFVKTSRSDTGSIPSIRPGATTPWTDNAEIIYSGEAFAIFTDTSLMLQLPTQGRGTNYGGSGDENIADGKIDLKYNLINPSIRVYSEPVEQ